MGGKLVFITNLGSVGAYKLLIGTKIGDLE